MRRPRIVVVSKLCSKCKVEKDSFKFYKNDKLITGLDSRCINCRLEDKQKWHSKNKDKVAAYGKAYRIENIEQVKLANRNSKLKKTFGITIEEFNKILESQNNVCAICHVEKSMGRGTFHVDHDHSTGLIRGLLCSKCNLLLGKAKDSVEILQKAITYLNENK